MCGRYTLTRSRNELEGGFPQLSSLPQDRIFAERFNVAPTQEVVALTRPESSDAPVAELLRWGLVPHWSKSADDTVKMINARAETVTEKPSYKGLIATSSGRCAILADGFYEWESVGSGPKQPWRFTVDGESVFVFAGLCTSWTEPNSGRTLRSCVIITTEPNSVVMPIHDRMPAILASPEAVSEWLDPAVGAEGATALLGPLTAGRVTKAKAARAVGRPRNEGPALLVPEQSGLF